MKILSLPFFKKIGTWKALDWILVILALALLWAVSFPLIGKASIWFDEAFSAYISHFSYVDIARFTSQDVHPPLYYWILKAWQVPFGSSAVALRSLSLVFSSIALIFGYLLTRRLFGRRAAALSLLFVALSPMIIRYSREARMYTQAAAIVMAATYAFVVAQKSRKTVPWIIYGILVSAGMWTHYFTIFVWITHWIWRYVTLRHEGARGKILFRRFFSRQWVIAYLLAIALFIPWLPLMVAQLAGIQSTGFWIGPVGVTTPVNYLTNFFLYQEHDNVMGWLSVLMWVVTGLLVALGYKTYKRLNHQEKHSYTLVLFLATIPVIILILISLPPLHPSYVERYLMPSIFFGNLLLAILISVGLARFHWWKRGVLTMMILALFIVGIVNVNYYGNYNKNTNAHVITNQLIAAIDRNAAPGEPIIADSPWIFYEAVFYDTSAHPIYFINADTTYDFGSLAMLKDSNDHKIIDANSFFKEHQKVWYFGITSDPTVASDRTQGWKALRTISVYDPINNTTTYKATEYQTN